MRITIVLLFYLSLVSCKSCKNVLQIQNEFVATINGNAWSPKGYNGTPNLYYTSGANTNLDISAYRRTDTSATGLTSLILFVDSLANYPLPHTFSLKPGGNAEITYSQYPCTYNSRNSTSMSTGSITISTIDSVAGTIGTFSAVLIENGCDTITINDGKFNLK